MARANSVTHAIRSANFRTIPNEQTNTGHLRDNERPNTLGLRHSG